MPSTATERIVVPRLHAAGSYQDEMARMREHLEHLMQKIRMQGQTIEDLTCVCEGQRDEIDRLRKAAN